ncbi:MAG: NUDIX hydrolase [Corynebacterium sp.]|nr:NUDIX hydrolase [Corynebacterium sp.]
MAGEGNGWAAGPNGSQLWGRFGAAGLLLFSPHSILLQHRAAWTAQGNTWALPGGARDPGETARMAAAREAWEETRISDTQFTFVREIRTSGPFPADPARPELAGEWTYTTVLAFSEQELATEANEESLELLWVPFADVATYNLLPAFGSAWPQLYAAVAEYLHDCHNIELPAPYNT